MRFWIILLSVSAAVVVAARLAFAGPVPEVGTTAPDFSLPSEDGTPVSLKDYRSKWIVLYFYPKDFTSGCTVEARNFQRDHDQYAKKSVIVIGVSMDSTDSHKKFCAKEGLNFKLLADTDHKVSNEYGSVMNFGVTQIAARHTFIIDPEGEIVRTYTRVNPNKHSEEVLVALDELQKKIS